MDSVEECLRCAISPRVSELGPYVNQAPLNFFVYFDGPQFENTETVEPKVANAWGIDKGQAYATVKILRIRIVYWLNAETTITHQDL